MLTGPSTWQHLATGFDIGMRFHSAPVVRLADAKTMQLGHSIRADGRWRLFLFADDHDPSSDDSRLKHLCDFLETDPSSPVLAHTAAGEDQDAVIDIRGILQCEFLDINLGDLPAILRPSKGQFGLIDQEKAFCPDFKNTADIFDMRGIDRSAGCMVIVRPDQYVAHILPLDATADLSTFFRGFLLDRRNAG
jgi:phenol 2-monooxygenase